MNATGVIFALAATVSWAICVFPFTSAARVMTVSAMNLFRLAAGTLAVLALSAIADPSGFAGIFSAEYINTWLWFGLSGILALGIGDYFNYHMYVILSPRYGSALTTLSPAAALLFGHLLLDERMNVTGVIGMVITIAGVMGMSLCKKERVKMPNQEKGMIMKGILYGIVAAMCTGAGLVFSKMGFKTRDLTGDQLNPLTASFIRFFVASCVVFLVTVIWGNFVTNLKRIRIQQPGVLVTALTGVAFGPVLGVGFALASIQYIPVAISQTIFALVPVVTLLIAGIVYREPINARAVIGVLLAIAGVILLVWRIEIQQMALT